MLNMIGGSPVNGVIRASLVEPVTVVEKLDVMSEIAEVIKSRKEKITRILSETAAVEQVYLSDVECNLLNGLTLAKDSIVALESSNKALLDALAARDTDLARAVHESSQLLMQLKVQTDRLAFFEEEQKSFVSREDAWKAWMKAEDISMKSLQERLDGLSEALRTKEEALVIITREHGACRLTFAKCTELEATLEKTKSVLEAESAEKRRLQDLLTAADDALAKTKAELDAKIVESDGLDANLKLVKQLKVGLEANFSTTKNSLDQTLSELSSTRGRFEEADALAKSLRKRLDDGEKEKTKLNVRITELEAALNKSEVSMSDLKISSNKKITELSASFAEKSSAFEDASLELGAVKTTLEALTVQLTKLKSDEKVGHEVIRVQKAKLEQAGNETLVLKKEIEDLNIQLKDADKGKAGLISDIDGLKEQLKGRSKELSASQNEIEQFKFKIEALRRDIVTLNADKDKVSQESLSRETARVTLEMELNKIRAMFSETEAELKSVRDELKKRMDEISMLTASSPELQLKLTAAEERALFLEAEMQRQKKEATDTLLEANKKIDSAKAELAGKDSQLAAANKETSDVRERLQNKDLDLKAAREQAERDLAAAASSLEAKIQELEMARAALASMAKPQIVVEGAAPVSPDNQGAKDALLKMAEGAAADSKKKLAELDAEKRRLLSELVIAKSQIETLQTELDQEMKRRNIALNEVESLRNILGLPPADLTTVDSDIVLIENYIDRNGGTNKDPEPQESGLSSNGSSSNGGIGFTGIFSSLFGGSQPSHAALSTAPTGDQQQAPSEEATNVVTIVQDVVLPASTPTPILEISASERERILMENPLDQVKFEKKLSTTDGSKLDFAATEIQRVVRGAHGRRRVKKHLESIPHVLLLTVNNATDILGDYSGFKPDTYVVATVLRKARKGSEKCVCAAKTSVVAGSTSPIFGNELVLSTAGNDDRVILNVMSSHIPFISGNGFLGQAVIDFKDYRHMGDGKPHKLKLNLGPAKCPLYDESGNVFSSTNANVSGSIDVTVFIPAITESICGWFWNITESFFDVSGEKMWVVLNKGVMTCWGTPFQTGFIAKVECKKIKKCVEKEFDKLSCKIVMYGVGLSMEGGAQHFWAWGDDAKSTKGLWKKALMGHIADAKGGSY